MGYFERVCDCNFLRSPMAHRMDKAVLVPHPCSMTTDTIPSIAGVILAGGLATRMGGRDKALLPLGNTTLLDLVISRLAPQCGKIAINANGDISRFSTFGLPVIADSLDGHLGPLAGILAGMNWGSSIGADAIVTVATDTPFVPSDLIERLVEASHRDSASIVLAASPDAQGIMRTHPTFGLWPVNLRKDLHGAVNSGMRKVGQWAHGHGASIAEFDSKPFDPFININTPEDLAAARVLAGQ